MSDTNTVDLTIEPSISPIYSFHINDCRFTSCYDENSHSTAGQVSADGLSATIGPWTAKISHDNPGRLVIRYDDPITTEHKYFYRLLKEGVFKVESSPKLRAYWSYVVPILEILKDRFGITTLIRNDPNTSYVCDSCQHEGPDGKHRFCFAVSDGDVSSRLNVNGDSFFDPDDAESLFFYNGKIKYRVENAVWAVVGSAVTESDSSVISKYIHLYVGPNYPNLYLLTLELESFLMKKRPRQLRRLHRRAERSDLKSPACPA